MKTITLAAVPDGITVVRCERDDPRMGLIEDGRVGLRFNSFSPLGFVASNPPWVIYLFWDGEDDVQRDFLDFAAQAGAQILASPPSWARSLSSAGGAAGLWAGSLLFAAPSAAGFRKDLHGGCRLLVEPWAASLATLRDWAAEGERVDDTVNQGSTTPTQPDSNRENMRNSPSPLPPSIAAITDRDTKRRATTAFEAANDLLVAIDEYRQWAARRIGWYREAPEDCLQALEKIARAGRLAMQRLEDCRLKSGPFSDLQADASPMQCWPWPPSELVDVETYVDPRYRDDWIRDGAVVFDMLPAELKQLLDWLERAPSEILLPPTAREIPPRTVPSAPQHLDGLPISQVQAAMIDETGVDVLKVLNQPNLSADQKMRALGRIDCRYDGYSSLKWGKLLHVTPAAIRQTDRWKELQQAKRAGPE